ncbi:MAG: hypothetical protein ACKO3T_11790 [Planctomycetaceae bacterium]|jgi:hypothetical protein
MSSNPVMAQINVSLAVLKRGDGKRAVQQLEAVELSLLESDFPEDVQQSGLVRIRNAERYLRSSEPGAAVYELTQLRNALRPVHLSVGTVEQKPVVDRPGFFARWRSRLLGA